MKSKFKITSIFFMLALMAQTLSAQFSTDNGGYGGQTDPNLIVGGRYANQTAVFDSTGTLKGIDSASFCATCPTPVTLLRKTILLSPSQILALYSTPDTLLRSPGANKVINVTSAFATIYYGSATYASDSVLVFTLGGITTGNYAFGGNIGVLNAATGVTGKFALNVNPVGSNSIVPVASRPKPTYQGNAPLLITTANANPTAGNSYIQINLEYTIENIVEGGGM